jgi:hypothetical protein
VITTSGSAARRDRCWRSTRQARTDSHSTLPP